MKKFNRKMQMRINFLLNNFQNYVISVKIAKNLIKCKILNFALIVSN